MFSDQDVYQISARVSPKRRFSRIRASILPDEERSFTFPQVSPSLLIYETPSSLDTKVPLIPAPSDVVVLCTTKLGTKVKFNMHMCIHIYFIGLGLYDRKNMGTLLKNPIY